MSPERWRRLHDVVDAALEQPASDRRNDEMRIPANRDACGLACGQKHRRIGRDALTVHESAISAE